MKAGVCCVAALMGAMGMGIAGEVAAESNSPPLTPHVPTQETPIVLAQADTSGASLQPDFILKDCQETESTGDPKSAIRGIYPAENLTTYLGNRDHRLIYPDTTASIKTTLQESTKQGILVPHTAPNGALYYMYAPVPNYVGEDQAVFMAEFEGKRYKIVVKLVVSLVVDYNSPQCTEPQLIKVKKPSAGTTGFDLNTVAFADLAGRSGQARFD